MADYKNTISLPKTTFPMKANLAELEPKMLQFWTEQNIYAQLQAKRKNCPKFIVHDGPPYANGEIHIGHALNKILKDIVVKSKTLSGYQAPFVPGWDCHGLPIEHQVEKKIGKVGHKFSAAEFRTACRAYASSQLDNQRENFKRLLILGTWDAPYTTMDHAFEANTIRALAHLVEKGHVYKGYKPVYWCLECTSALAEAEVEYQEKQSAAIDVLFKWADTRALAQIFKTVSNLSNLTLGMVVWTTTPWTLPANQAVAIHPALQYVLVQVTLHDQIYGLILAQDLLPSVLTRFALTTHKILGTCLGYDLEHLRLRHPCYDRFVPIVLGDHVTTDAGTGAVHTAPAHGQEDYRIALQYQLPVENPVGATGCFLENTPLFAGLHVLKADAAILQVLRDKGTLLHKATITHSYPHCWRHKTPVIFRATEQWFISMDKLGLRERAVSAIAQVNWIPDWGGERLANMIKNRPDWCISRQRTWGVPLPFFVHRQTGELHPEMAIILQKVADAVEQAGIEAWYTSTPETFLGTQSDYEKSPHILDVWFESGVTHYCVLNRRSELAFPADLYLEGPDQHRGWFQSSLLTSVGMEGKAPYHTVLTHGYTVDAMGRKMSKSLGNVISPQTVIQKRGADVLRFWVASTDYCGKEITISEEILDRAADGYRKIRNTARYILSNLFDFEPSLHLLPGEVLLPLDVWALASAITLQRTICDAYAAYQFHTVSQKIQHFCTLELSGCYFDIIKDRLYTTPPASHARRSAQTTLYHIGEALTRWLAPILSASAEEIWQALPGAREESVFLSDWYTGFPVTNIKQSFPASFWETLWRVRTAVNKALEGARFRGLISGGLTAEVILYADEPLQKQLAFCGQELRFICITSDAAVLRFEHAPEDADITEIPGLKINIKSSLYSKCIRCWHQRDTVGQNAEHPELCDRCIENISGIGEHRTFA